MGLLAPLLRPFRRPATSAQSAAPLPTAVQSSINTTDININKHKQKTKAEGRWFQTLRLPLRRTGGVQTVKVTSDHYLGFTPTDSGYASKNSSESNVTAVTLVNPATATSPPTTSASSPTTAASLPAASTSPPASSGSDTPTLVDSSTSAINETSSTKPKSAKDVAALPPVIIAAGTELKRTLGSLVKAAINYECPKAINTINYIKLLQALAVRQFDLNIHWDPPIVWNDQAFLLSQVSGVGQDWIDRFEFAQKLYALTEKQLVHPEDMEDLVNWLFAEDESNLLPSIVGRLVINNLVDEGCLTRAEGNRLAALALTIEEVKDCGQVVERGNMPPQEKASGVFRQLPLLPGEDRTRALLRLSEAAAYCVSEHAGGVWYGLRYRDARTDIKKYIKACEGAEQGYVRPELVKYARTWTEKEKRILQRSQLVMELLDRWDAGKINDFGVIKYTRNSFFQFYHQPRGDQETLAGILYNKVEGSGIDCEEVPRIVALLPCYDKCRALGGQPWIDLKSKLVAELMEHKQINKQLIEEHKAAKKAYKAYIKGPGKKDAAASKKKAAKPFDPYA
ncbi:hypothetical protein DM02DRAFT_610854 [Periconia macrospinosa]|uniref:Uncharacterized protein n=1 Tax=Periconia macrospinosa TaxID=97972 RepID=A0A2V1E3X6_9PLEO|nr:hypothetical protein DM02DRAFT_610854 [Periconia macrospinosa]